MLRSLSGCGEVEKVRRGSVLQLECVLASVLLAVLLTLFVPALPCPHTAQTVTELTVMVAFLPLVVTVTVNPATQICVPMAVVSPDTPSQMITEVELSKREVLFLGSGDTSCPL